MANRIIKGDKVRVIAGSQKGKEGQVVKTNGRQVFVENINVKERHVRPTQINPKGGKKDVHVGLDISNVVLIVDDKPVKVAFKVTADKKVRIDKKTGKEIK